MLQIFFKKKNLLGTNAHFEACGASMQGFRVYMEDESLIWLRDDNFAVVGIFDGHSGNAVSKHIARELPGIIATLR